MNDHKLACVVLLLLIAGMLYSTQEMKARTDRAADAARSAELAAENAQMQRSIAETSLIALQRDTHDLRDGYAKWGPYFAPITSPQDAEGFIADAVRKGDVFLLHRQTTVKEFQGDDRGVIYGVFEGEFDFEDDYVKTLNWLGQLEEDLPSCRITRLNAIRGDRENNVRLNLKIEVPLMDPNQASAFQTNPPLDQ